MASIILYLSIMGVACWMPGLTPERPGWVGLRFALAVLTVPIYLYIGNVLFDVPLSVLAYVYAGLAILGGVYSLCRQDRPVSAVWTQLLHPVAVFPVLAFGLSLWVGDVTYLPFPSDETGSWLLYARQVFLADAYWSPQLIYHHGGYTNGWPLMVAFSNLFSKTYVDLNASVFLFFMHLGVIGFTYDLTEHMSKRFLSTGLTDSSVVGWITVLALLTVEASWVLFPTFQGIEKPLLYVYLIAFLLALSAQYEEFDGNLLAILLGWVFAAGYLMKVAFIVFAPVLGILWIVFYLRSAAGRKSGLFSSELVRLGLVRASLMLGPAVFVAITWSQMRVGGECFASPWEYFSNPSQLFSDYSLRVASVIAESLIAYTFEYKWPLTLIGGIVLTSSLLWPRARWFAVMIGAFVALFVVSMHLAYYFCFSPFSEFGLQSFQRYYRPNLRFIHLFSILIVIFFVLERLGEGDWLKEVLHKNRFLLIAAVLVLLGVQVVSLKSSIADISTRAQYAPDLRDGITNTKRESSRLIDLVRERGLINPKISVVAQGAYSIEFDLARYFGIKTKRGGEYFEYTPIGPYSWSQSRINSFTKISSANELATWWKEFPIIWPIRTDPWTRNVLSALVDSDECRLNPEKFFLFNRGDGRFECVPKGG